MPRFIKIFSLLSIVMLIPESPLASNPYEVNQLIVFMRNVGAEHCLLRSLKIFQGEMIGGDIPRRLDATGQNLRFVMQGTSIDLVMSYQCGKYKDFTISMKQHFSRGLGQAQIVAKFYNQVNVFENHIIEPGYISCPQGSGCSSIPSKITWEISN